MYNENESTRKQKIEDIINACYQNEDEISECFQNLNFFEPPEDSENVKFRYNTNYDYGCASSSNNTRRKKVNLFSIFFFYYNYQYTMKTSAT